MRALKWFVGFGLILIAALAATLLWLRELDLSEQSGVLATELSELIGRKLKIGGPLRVGLSLWPRVVAEDLTLANPSWASRGAMLEAKRVDFVLAIWPLLSGRIEVSRIELEEVSIWIEPNASGVVNWDLGAGQETNDAGAPEFDLRRIRATRARVIWRVAPGSKWHRWRIAELVGRAEGERAPLELKLRSRLDRDALILEGRIGSLPQMTQGEPFEVDLRGRWGDSRVAISGKIADAAALTGIDLEASLEAPSLSGVPIFAELSSPGKLNLTGRVQGQERALVVPEVALQLGKSDLRGHLRLHFEQDKDAPVHLSGELKSSVVDVAELLNASKEDREDPASQAANSPGDELFSREPLHLAELTRPGLELELAADADTLRVGGEARFEVIHAKVELGGGRLKLAPIEGSFRGTRLEAELEIDGRGELPLLRGRLLGKDFDLGAWLERVGVSDRIVATIDVALDVKGEGDSVAAILGTLDGKAAAAISQGQIPTQYVDVAVADLARLLVPWSSPTELTDIECAVVQFDIDAGVGRTQLMMFDTDKMTLTGQGDVDLRNETLDFVLAPRPRNTRLLSLATDVVLKGPIANPSARPHAIGLASTLVRFAFGPTRLLLPFGVLGAKDQHPCVDAVQQVIAEADPASASSSSTPPEAP